MALLREFFGQRIRGLGGEQDQSYAADFFLRSAQRFFIASPIRLRAAADRCRFRPLVVLLSGRPRLCWPPRNAAIALFRRSRSASSSAMIDCVSK
jgi:hypothetical protein